MQNILVKKNKVRLQISSEKNGTRTLKALLYHPMETGRRRDRKTGKFIPADYINEIRFSIDGDVIFEMGMGENVSRNPYLSFSITRKLVDNHALRISWIDNMSRETVYDTLIHFTEQAAFNYEAVTQNTEVVPLTVEQGPVCRNKPKPDLRH